MGGRPTRDRPVDRPRARFFEGTVTPKFLVGEDSIDLTADLRDRSPNRVRHPSLARHSELRDSAQIAMDEHTASADQDDAGGVCGSLHVVEGFLGEAVDLVHRCRHESFVEMAYPIAISNLRVARS